MRDAEAARFNANVQRGKAARCQSLSAQNQARPKPNRPTSLPKLPKTSSPNRPALTKIPNTSALQNSLVNWVAKESLTADPLVQAEEEWAQNEPGTYFNVLLSFIFL